MRILKSGKLHPQAVITCEHCEAILMVNDHECIKLVFEFDVVKYVVKCPECESQIMFAPDLFSSMGTPVVRQEMATE